MMIRRSDTGGPGQVCAFERYQPRLFDPIPFASDQPILAALETVLLYVSSMQRVWIYGSCVTRDGVDFWSEYALEMAGYTARQSLISTTAPADPRDFDTSAIPSAFQRRMAEGDIVGDVVKKLVANADSYDAIVWDVTDERLGVYRIPSGGYVSRVVDYSNGIYRGARPLSTPIRIGSSDHKRLWESALTVFLNDLEAAGVRDRLILNALPWATHDEGGRSTTGHPSNPILFNSVLTEYADLAERRGVRVARTDPARVVQADEHQWGSAPFHYTPDTYHASLEAVREIL